MRMRIFVFIFLLLLSLLQGVHLKVLSSQNYQNTVQDIDTTTVSGKVLKLDNNRITLRTESHVRELILPKGISVTRNNIDSGINDVRLGDWVSVIIGKEGEILAADAQSSKSYDGNKWVSGIGIGLIFLFGLLFFYQQRQKNFIKTTIPSV